MKTLKKIVALMLALTLVLVYAPPAMAATDNTEVKSAVDISSGGKTIDFAEVMDQRKYYVFTAQESGYVSFTIAREDYSSTDRPRWNMYVYDGRMNQICNGYAENESYTSQTLMANKGDTYYLEVYGYNRASTQMTYYVQANFTSYEFIEIEDNDSSSEATKLENGNLYLGNMISFDDVDFYKITASKSGVYTIHFDRHEFTSTNTSKWYFALYDSNMNQLYESDTYNNKEDGINVNYVLAKGKSIYVRIKNCSSSIGETYEIKTTFNKKTYIETEKNDDFSTADTVKLSKVYCGVLAESGTKAADYFVFKAEKSGTYKITFSLAKDLTYAQKITVYDASHKEIKTSDKIYKNGSISFKANKGKKYYISVKHADGSIFGGYNVGILYKLKVAKKK